MKNTFITLAFKPILESNLETFEQAEDYEGCAQIKKAIEQLKK